MRNPLPDLRLSWIALGWFVAAALTSFLLLAMIAVGLTGDSPEEGYWVPLAIAAGFGLAGFVTGMRVGVYPILHAVGMGLFSVVVWFAVNLFLGEPTEQSTWGTLVTEATFALLALQVAAAAVGARMGVRFVRPESR